MNLLTRLCSKIFDGLASETSVFKINAESPRIAESILPFDPYIMVAGKILPTAQALKSHGQQQEKIIAISGNIRQCYSHVSSKWWCFCIIS